MTQYKGFGDTSDRAREKIPKGAVRQKETRGNATDSDTKPLITKFLRGHRGELCALTGKVCCVLDAITGDRRN